MSTTETTTTTTSETTEPATDEPTTTTEPDDTTAPAAEGTPGEDDHEDDSSKAGREAARYRRQLRETEAERDALAARVETLQRAEVERLAGESLSRPAALWAAGHTLADLLDESGDVDPAKVTTAAQAAQEALGLAAPVRTPRPDPSQGAGAAPDPASAWERAMTVR